MAHYGLLLVGIIKFLLQSTSGIQISQWYTKSSEARGWVPHMPLNIIGLYRIECNVVKLMGRNVWYNAIGVCLEAEKKNTYRWGCGGHWNSGTTDQREDGLFWFLRIPKGLRKDSHRDLTDCELPGSFWSLITRLLEKFQGWFLYTSTISTFLLHSYPYSSESRERLDSKRDTIRSLCLLFHYWWLRFRQHLLAELVRWCLLRMYYRF